MRQVYSYSATIDQDALFAAISSNRVACVRREDAGTQRVVVDFLPDSTSTEQTTVQGIVTGAPYNLALQSSVGDSTYPWLSNDAKATTPWDLPNCELVLEGGHTVHMYQEDQTSATIRTPVAANADPIGLISEPSPNAHTVQALTSGTRPTLQSDGLPESHIRFTAASTQRLQVRNSILGAFNWINTTGVFSVLIRLRTQTDGTTRYILESNGSSTANSGVAFWLDTSNHVNFLVTKAVGGQAVFSGTTTATILGSDGFVNIYVTCDGGTLRIEVGARSQAAETFARLNSLGGGNPFSNLIIGATNAGASGLDASVQCLSIHSANLNSAQRTQFAAYAVRRSTAYLLRLARVAPFNFVSHFFKFYQSTGQFTDTAGTVAVATNGDAVAWVDSATDPNRRLNRRLLQSTLANRPAWRPAHPGLEFNGAASPNYSTFPMGTGADGFANQGGGAYTFLAVVMNRDTTNGSHYAYAGGSSYAVETGHSYSGNTPNPGASYSLIHDNSAGEVTLVENFNDSTDQLMEFGKTGTTLRQRTSRAAILGTSGVASGTGSGNFNVQEIGREAIVGWAMDGFYSLFLWGTMDFSAPNVDTYIIPFIRATFPSMPLN